MTYKEGNLLTKQELSGVNIDSCNQEGQSYSAPFCFHPLEDALNYGKLCIDQSIQLRSLQKNVNEIVDKRIIS